VEGAGDRARAHTEIETDLLAIEKEQKSEMVSEKSVADRFVTDRSVADTSVADRNLTPII